MGWTPELLLGAVWVPPATHCRDRGPKAGVPGPLCRKGGGFGRIFMGWRSPKFALQERCRRGLAVKGREEEEMQTN